MTFLHPEFLLWMSLPVGILFYFWLTQQPHQHDHFTPRAWEMLLMNDSTLGLHGRNTLFLIASLLLIIALSEPVVEEKKIPLPPQPLTIALNLSLRPADEFDLLKHKILTIIDSSDAPIALVAYDIHLYRIAPSSEDKASLKKLIQYLSPSVMHDLSADPTVLKRLPHPWIEVSNTDPLTPKEHALVHPPKETTIYFPLFYLPLGLAMLLIGLGLISMSQRQSVALGIMVVLMVGSPPKIHAGMMDFRLLDGAIEAYQQGHYPQSATLFLAYQRLHDSPQVRYNLANAYFKSGKYDQATYWYAHVHPTDPRLAQWVALNQQRILRLQKGKVQTTSKEALSQKISHNQRGTKEKKRDEEAVATPLFAY